MKILQIQVKDSLGQPISILPKFHRNWSLQWVALTMNNIKRKSIGGTLIASRRLKMKTPDLRTSALHQSSGARRATWRQIALRPSEIVLRQQILACALIRALYSKRISKVQAAHSCSTNTSFSVALSSLKTEKVQPRRNHRLHMTLPTSWSQQPKWEKPFK